MSASLILHRLQQVDRQIDQAQARLSTIRKTLENDVELREALLRFDTSKESHLKSEHALKQSEMDVQSQQVKIQQTESSLYGGKVHNPKELQDLQNDIAALKRHLTTLEERELEAMQQVETIEAEFKQAKENMEVIQAKRGSEHSKLIQEQDALTRDLERLSSERLATIGTISNQVLDMYESLRQQKRGVAVTEVNDNTCGACGTTIPAAVQQSARSASGLAYCPTCGRILYSG